MDIGDIIVLVCIVVGLIVNSTMFRATLADHERRITNVEQRMDKEMVPRAEIDSKDRLLNSRFDMIENLLRDIQTRLIVVAQPVPDAHAKR